MPNCDARIVSYLLKETEAEHSALLWSESAPDAYTAALRGIELELFKVGQGQGRRLQLTLWCSSGKIDINEDTNETGRQLRNLGRAVMDRCASQEKFSQTAPHSEWFYQRLAGVEVGAY